MNAEEIVKKLSSFPNRACAGIYEPKVLAYFKSLFNENNTKIEGFSTPKNYLVIVAWLIGGISIGLILSSFWPIAGFIITLFFGVSAFRYFNWYSSPVALFPPQVQSNNVIVKDEQKSKTKVILMAHWDTAPISILYSPGMVGNFRVSLKISMALIGLSVILSFSRLFFNLFFIDLTLYALFVYFLIQMIVASIDFFRLGYSNGASDNATGIAAAITTAKNLWDLQLKQTEVELVLTGAEEVGMIGAKAYFDTHKNEFNQNTYLINFDTLGAGDLKIINKTGSWSTIIYDNFLTQTAENIIKNQQEFAHVTLGAWHTADFDSVWFQRAGVQSFTLAALDNNGRMPNIHRETDVLANVDFKPMHDAIKLATEIVKVLDYTENKN